MGGSISIFRSGMMYSITESTWLVGMAPCQPKRASARTSRISRPRRIYESMREPTGLSRSLRVYQGTEGSTANPAGKDSSNQLFQTKSALHAQTNLPKPSTQRKSSRTASAHLNAPPSSNTPRTPTALTCSPWYFTCTEERRCCCFSLPRC